ncbi:MAG: NAD(+) synthase [Lachnospiraceae bacterium]|nr:NAD(+) synthase [Lachnospiraceae bacterium]
MKDGFIKVAALSPGIRVADCVFNTESICAGIDEAVQEHVKILVFPELCITGYTCGDLFWQETLLLAARRALAQMVAYSAGKDALIFAGLPLEVNGKLYNVAAAFSDGELLGFVPKRYLPNYNEFYEARHFTPGNEAVTYVEFDGRTVPFGMNLLFVSETESRGSWTSALEAAGKGTENDASNGASGLKMPPEMGLVVAAELCEDLWAPNPPSIAHALAGANVIVNLSASDEVAGKSDYRRSLVEGQSARLLCGYIYASAGEGESTQDLVYGGHSLIAENGHILAQSPRFESGITFAEFDIGRLRAERRRMTTFPAANYVSGYGMGNRMSAPDNAEPGRIPGHTAGRYASEGSLGAYVKVPFHLYMEETPLTRSFDPAPFVPAGEADRGRRCEEILMIQALGLKKRMRHTGAKSIVVGISGGLDSTLALLVMTKACDLLDLPRATMTAVTMPGFGTTDRTYQNACSLTKSLGAQLLEVDIRDAVNIHFRDIGQDPEVHDVTYENSQARERTQILMDIANKTGGLVVGTGDMSELALGWATYNGDHMSMYAVNCSVPKTLVRHLMRYYADTCGDNTVSEILYDVLDTPVSPELLPPQNGEIAQKTEDIVGPYELHDFFLYYLLRFGYSPTKIYRIAKLAFAGVYDEKTILKWLKVFYRRFFAQQFKRSCIPDGPKVGSVALSPRGDLRMPSDACARLWMDELERL